MRIFLQVAQIAGLRGVQSVVGTFLVTWIGSHKSAYRLQQRLFGEGNKIIVLIVIFVLILPESCSALFFVYFGANFEHCIWENIDRDAAPVPISVLHPASCKIFHKTSFFCGNNML